MTKKVHTNKFKSTVVLDALKGVETITSLAQKYEVHPSQIQNWKTQAFEGFSDLFGSKGTLKKKSEDSVPMEELERKIGKLTMENDFLKKNSEISRHERMQMIDKHSPLLSLCSQCKLLMVNRSSLYYEPTDCSSDTVLMNKISETWHQTPVYGYRRICAQLNRDGVV